MFKSCALGIIAIAIVSVKCWKPISSPTTSFTIRQSHPALGAVSHSRNTIGGDTSAGINRHGYVLTDHEFGNDALFGSAEVSEYQGFGQAGGFFPAARFNEDACSIDKYAFDFEGTVHLKKKLPKMDQFTICFWMRFTNHTGDHTVFTYSVDDEPREIQIWVANSRGSSYISMAVHGQSLYRLNYPLKMRVWHHACSSWNGKTGEWQLWMKAERVGRGFHNRLVNHVIPGNGILFAGGPSITGHTAIGLHFEMTLLQIYKVALTAGKAHRDHKHHHVHHFDHDGLASTTTPAPTPAPQAPQVMNPLLANGQIPTRVKINLADQQSQQQPMALAQVAPIPGIPSQLVGGILPAGLQRPVQQATITTNFANGQFHSAGRLLSQQLISSGPTVPNSPLTFPGGNNQQPQPQRQFIQISNPTNVQFIDGSDQGSRFLFKRESDKQDKSIKKRETQTDNFGDKKLNKRGLVMLGDGSIIDDTFLAHGYQFEGLAQFGLPAFKEDLRNRMNIEDEIKEHDREPAEDEVKAVMELCTACDEEPFKGAIALAWKDVHASQDQTLKGRSVGGCGYF